MKVGANVDNMEFDIDHDFGDEPETKSKLGFHIGFITDISLIENTLSIQPALLYSNKGYSFDMEKMLEDELDQYDLNMKNYEGYVKVNYDYIELPINFVCKNGGFQVSAGPYFAIGIGGAFKSNFSFIVDGEKYDEDDFFEEDSYILQPVLGEVDDDMIENYFEDDDDVYELYCAYDFGFNFGVGYQVKSILFNVGYSLGLANLTPEYDTEDYDYYEDYTENVIQKNSVLTFSTSYFFN
ncbi:PorT family protein [Bacteroidales bacterium]|nr:PorT family protein [Bacteroidales bacterium]